VKLNRWMFVCLAACVVISATAGPAVAEFSAKDGQVLGRTLRFIGDGTRDVAVIGVIVAPDTIASQRDADAIKGVIGDALTTGRVRLQMRLIAVDQLATASDVAALYVTAGLDSKMEAIGKAAQHLHVPTISADMVCVESGGCVVGFSSEPTVRIVIDRGQADRLGVHFKPAFRLLVREK
jgi:hypothetical protein